MNREVKPLPIILLATSVLLLIPIFFYPSDWAGWLLVYFSFALPLLFPRVRRDRKLVIIFLIITAIHNGVSIYNVYGSTIYGAALDAATFQERAREIALSKYPLWFADFDALEIGSSIYTRFLATFYRTFGVSLLLGQTLSVLAYSLSGIVLIYLVSLLKFRFRRAIFAIYGISPPAFVFCSVTMREAWQVLLFMLILYLALRLRSAPSLSKAIGIPLAGLGLGMLHNGLYVFSLALVGWSLYWGASGRWQRGSSQKVFIRAGVLFTAVLVFGVWLYLGGEVGGISGAIRSGEAVSYTETYREKGDQDAAANYYVKVDGSTPLTFTYTSAIAFFYYQFAPFPWQIRRVIDIYAGMEAFLRFLLIVFMVKLWWQARGERRSRYAYVMIGYLSLEFLWSLGTSNWGNAIRHHVVAYGALVVLGAPGLIYQSQRLLMRLKFRTSKVSQYRRYATHGAQPIGKPLARIREI